MYLLLLAFIIINHSAAQNQKPNVIFILGDDVSYATPNVNGGTSYSTPNLDTMALRGMNFIECHASPLCSPSRFMLLTGKYNFRNYTEWGNMDTSQRTIGNMFEDAGYKTACFGKWQLDGGDFSIHNFGFNNYCVWNPFGDKETARYKNPDLYTNGMSVPDSLTQNKYGEDIVADSVMNFIERNKSVPFFVYYPMLLVHPPFQPTPDDTAYAAWDSPDLSDTAYYASMVEYMDKKIGQVINKVKELGIEENTVIIYVGDNGASRQISQYANDSLLNGGKGLTTESGTRVPMLIDWPGTIKAGSINKDLIGFTDFLPTLADIAHIPLPTNYGPLDGVDFAPRLSGNAGTPRDWLFYHYDPRPGSDSLKRWAQTEEYKLYDTSLYNSSRLFYNIMVDKDELNPIPDASLTPDELTIKKQLLQVINMYVHEGTPILSNAVLSNITDSSAVLEDSIKIDGGSTIKADGAVWSTQTNPVISSSAHSSVAAESGIFQTLLTHLKANTTYYVRAYSKNIAGITYSNEIKFKTLLNSPVATAATSISNNQFIANWRSVKGASGYKLDVSSDTSFTTYKPCRLVQQFNNGIIPPNGWIFSNDIIANDNFYKNQSPSLELKTNNDLISTEKLNGIATQLKFWIKGLKTNEASALVIEGFDGTNWVLVDRIQPLPLTGTMKTYDSASVKPLQNNFIQFKFTYKYKLGALVFDDVSILYRKVVPSFLPGYDGLKVNDTSFLVTGLEADSNYYYRVRAINSGNTSLNSNVITATCTLQALNSNVINNVSESNYVTTRNNELKVDVFPNPTPDNFTLTVQSDTNKQIDIIVTDVYGRKVYQSKSDNDNSFLFGKKFNSGVYFVEVIQGNVVKRIKIIKSGK